MERCILEQPLDLSNTVVTVGTFDGIHLGHRAVLETVRAKAKERVATSVMLTFDPHPRAVINPNQAPALLTSLEEKTWRLGDCAVDLLAVVPFTQRTREMSPEAFVETYLVQYLKAKVVVLGYDHGFGRGRSGDLETMQMLGKRFGFDVFSVSPVLVDDVPVSSSRIRKLVECGRIAEACVLLGDGYSFVGPVIHGEGRGRQLGFPTANIALEEAHKLFPPNGVYAARVFLSSTYSAVLNLGVRPTFNGKQRLLEVHLLDFEGDLYGRTLRVDLVARLRDEKRFNNPEELIAQIQRDGQGARELLRKNRVNNLEVKHWD